MSRTKGYKHSPETIEKITIALRKPRPKFRGENHHRWVGDNISYMGIHWYLRRFKAKECRFCGGTEKLELALIKGYEHKRDISHYHTLCYKCHRKYDLAGRTAWNKGLKFIDKKTCPNCEKEYMPKLSRQIYCCRSCQSSHIMKKRIKLRKEGLV